MSKSTVTRMFFGAIVAVIAGWVLRSSRSSRRWPAVPS